MNTETAGTTATQQIADLILADVEASPMLYISDGGERARRTALHIRAQNELRTRDRIEATLADLATEVSAHYAGAQQQAARARMLGDVHAGDYAEGRARGCADTLDAITTVRVALAGGRGRTRQENAQAFAETIITGTYNTCHGDYHRVDTCTCPTSNTTGDTP